MLLQSLTVRTPRVSNILLPRIFTPHRVLVDYVVLRKIVSISLIDIKMCRSLEFSYIYKNTKYTIIYNLFVISNKQTLKCLFVRYSSDFLALSKSTS